MKREEELLECPVCWESFNLVENVPYVLWCGHTLCKSCILSLRWAEVKLPTRPIQLPFFVSCPWCQLLSLRMVWKDNLQYPRKNFFLLWLVETANGNRIECSPPPSSDHKPVQPSMNVVARQTSSYTSPIENRNEPRQSLGTTTGGMNSFLGGRRVWASLLKSLALVFHLTAKFPVVVTFMVIILYVVPICAAILVVYLLITFLFALPSIVVLYFSYPILDWLVREIIAQG